LAQLLDPRQEPLVVVQVSGRLAHWFGLLQVRSHLFRSEPARGFEQSLAGLRHQLDRRRNRDASKDGCRILEPQPICDQPLLPRWSDDLLQDLTASPLSESGAKLRQQPRRWQGAPQREIEQEPISEIDLRLADHVPIRQVIVELQKTKLEPQDRIFPRTPDPRRIT